MPLPIAGWKTISVSDFMRPDIAVPGFMVKSSRRRQLRVMTDDLKRAIGRRVRTARREAGVTQEDLAARTDRSTEAVSNIERGVSLPTLDTLERLAEALGAPLSFFFDVSDEAASPRRAEIEIRVRLLLRQLSDHDAEVALGLLQVLRDGGTG